MKNSNTVCKASNISNNMTWHLRNFEKSFELKVFWIEYLPTFSYWNSKYDCAYSISRKLDDAHETLKRKEKEFEDTMDHLQKDLDSLENERGELKNKLKETTMKVLLEGIASKQNVSMSQGGGPISFGPSVPAPVKDSPLLMRQLQDTQLALSSVREESYRYILCY